MISTLEQFAGNKPVIETVRGWLISGKTPQSIIIEGNEKSGRKTLAHLIASGLVCTGNNPPCGQCVQCKKSISGHPDISNVTGDLSKAAIGVDTIRDLRSDAFIMPNDSDRKTYIITRTMTVSAQNALLKIIEEPPKGVTFIIIVRNKEDLLETVRSRSAVLSLLPVGNCEGIVYLKSKFPDINDQKIQTVLERSGGIIGKAEILLSEKDDNNQIDKMLSEAADALANKNSAAFLAASLPAENNLNLMESLTNGLMLILRDAYCKKEGVGNCISGFEKESSVIAKRLPSLEITKMMDIAKKANARVGENPKGSLLVSCLCARLFDLAESV